MNSPYADIIHLPHHVSQNHPQMPMLDRAAQFAPFAALTGYEAAVGETARLTAERRELDAQEAEELNRRLTDFAARLKDRPEVTIEYFDNQKFPIGCKFRKMRMRSILTGLIRTFSCVRYHLCPLCNGTIVRKTEFRYTPGKIVGAVKKFPISGNDRITGGLSLTGKLIKKSQTSVIIDPERSTAGSFLPVAAGGIHILSIGRRRDPVAAGQGRKRKLFQPSILLSILINPAAGAGRFSDQVKTVIHHQSP